MSTLNLNSATKFESKNLYVLFIDGQEAGRMQDKESAMNFARYNNTHFVIDRAVIAKMEDGILVSGEVVINNSK